MNVRIATNDDGPRIGELVKTNGFDLGEMDWSDVEPWWLVAENGEGVVAAIQVTPTKPVGRMEMLAVDRDLSDMDRGRAISGLLDQAQAVLMVRGTQFVVGMVPFELRGYKRVLKRRGGRVISSGNLFAKRLT